MTSLLSKVFSSSSAFPDYEDMLSGRRRLPAAAASLVARLELPSETQIKTVTGADLDGAVKHHSCSDE